MNLSHKMRIYNRYLGFFLVGIMTVYAVSGIILIFRDTDFLKSEVTMVKTVDPNLSAEELGKAIRIRELKVDREVENVVYFKQGTYNKTTGVAEYKVKQLPFVIDKMTKLHKANTGHPLFFLNIFFGVSLLFFVKMQKT